MSKKFINLTGVCHYLWDYIRKDIKKTCLFQHSAFYIKNVFIVESGMENFLKLADIGTND
ncbi:hypothetical protein BpHYR1_003735 [Brachionus plicatilis]|uniref:Uncharacterized protein n=1 Tax=Brachionus plicatilis TaxID=10195 RepID=A0A3M7QTV5_BRAPC|nr:hypothetical protein BpHYR1_003735 [Brachionus plicatilis]